MSLTIKHSSVNQRRQEALQTTKRRKLILGRHVKQSIHGVQIGALAYYEPSAYASQYENTFIYGPQGSGKTWVGYSLASQSFFAEQRTWIIFDTKFSVTGDTLIHARVDGSEQVIEIGNLIDRIIPSNDVISIERPVDQKIEVLSICKDHKVRWKEVLHVSKHKSPERLLKVITRSGREVTSTEGHSFLSLKNGSYVPVKGSDLKKGDFLPVCDAIPFGKKESIDILEYFDENEIIDFDKIQYSIDMVQENIPLTVIYENSGLSSISYGAFWRYVKGERNFKSGMFKCITDNHSKTQHFPKEIELTRDFGFFCGIFVAEGYAVSKKGRNSIRITNQDPIIRKSTASWLESLSIPYLDNGKNVIVTSLPLTRLFTRWFGNGMATSSITKKLPGFIFDANEDFLKGFLNGYMSGDGYIRKYPRLGLLFTTMSDRLAIDLDILFSKFGMSVRFSKDKDGCNIGRFASSDILKFKEIGFTEPKKRNRLVEYRDIKGDDAKHLVDMKYIIDQVNIKREKHPSTSAIHDNFVSGKGSCSRGTVERSYHELKDDHPRHARKLLDLVNGDVWWDRIERIEMLEPATNFVYDLQVDETENFMVANGIFTHNSFLGNHRGNLLFYEDILPHGLPPCGIPGDRIRVIAPSYHLKTARVEDILESGVTHGYKIPLIMCGLEIMFELTKMKKGASYAATFEVKFNELLIKTKNKPTVKEFEEMIKDMTSDPDFPPQLTWVFNMMVGKIKDIAKFTIDEQNQWSSVGKALFDAARSQKPMWIVFSLGHAKTAQDDVNLALMTAVLTEIKAFAQEARLGGYPVNLGVMIDELHTYVNKDSTSVKAIHDLIFHWGRSQRLWRIYMTQKQEQLPKTFRDAIGKLDARGTFQNIISCQAIPEPGYGEFLDRLHSRDENSPIDNNPRYYPHVKFMPPIIEVESDFPDDAEWKRYVKSKLFGTKFVPKNKQKPVKTWEQILIEMMESGKSIDNAAMQLGRMRGVNVRTTVRNASNLPGIRAMWKDIRDDLEESASEKKKQGK